MLAPHLRIARPCDALEALVAMYRDGLGMHVLGGFQNHDGYDGAMLGLPGGPYHLELTRRRGHPAGPAPSAEHLLVFYEAEPSAWESACARMLAAGFRLVPAENPYWDVRGRTFADLEGYLVVWQRSTWPVTP
ncbi:MAG: VOC family protein [Deltaproteobacteria bacterium]|nr:VOC family protein [Deltaproteobacteria bacterium]